MPEDDSRVMQPSPNNSKIIYLTNGQESCGGQIYLIDVTKKFATPEACNDFIESIRWPDGVTYPDWEGKNARFDTAASFR